MTFVLSGSMSDLLVSWIAIAILAWLIGMWAIGMFDWPEP